MASELVVNHPAKGAFNGTLTDHKFSSRAYVSFFFQAEDGIRDYKVTGVQTCALPICPQLRMAERCGATESDGFSNAPTPGSETSGAWSCATTARSPSMAHSFISLFS